MSDSEADEIILDNTLEEVTKSEHAEGRKYGMIPDLPDHRDHLAAFDARTPIKEQVDLRQFIVDILDQGNSSSCTAHSMDEALKLIRLQKGLSNDNYSRLQIYYDEREVEGDVNYDGGAMIRDGLKNMASIGVAHEPLWPFNLNKLYDKPTDDVYEDAKNTKILGYKRLINDADTLKRALSAGYPIIAGISIYESFESIFVANNGKVPMPTKDEKLLGGHAVLIVGYKNGQFIVQNSWGEGWGDKGFFYIDEAYLANPGLCSDLWIITGVKFSDAEEMIL